MPLLWNVPGPCSLPGGVLGILGEVLEEQPGPVQMAGTPRMLGKRGSCPVLYIPSATHGHCTPVLRAHPQVLYRAQPLLVCSLFPAQKFKSPTDSTYAIIQTAGNWGFYFVFLPFLLYFFYRVCYVCVVYMCVHVCSYMHTGVYGHMCTFM